MKAASMETDTVLRLRPEDYQEPKTCFLLTIKRLALEGYSLDQVRRGMVSAYTDAFVTDPFRQETERLFNG